MVCLPCVDTDSFDISWSATSWIIFWDREGYQGLSDMLGVRLILVNIVYGAPVCHGYGVGTDQEGKRIKRHLGHQQKVYNV